jgi:uncharacterized protein YbcI
MNPDLDQLRRRVEETIGNTLTKLMKQQVGRGPENMKVYLVDDMILLRLKNVLTPAEAQVAATPEGRRLVEQFRTSLLDAWGAMLWTLVTQTMGAQIVCIHSDLNTAADHLVIIIVLDRKIAMVPDDTPEADRR